MKRSVIIIVLLLSIVSACHASRSLPWIELTFSPAKATEAAQKLKLLPTTEEQTDANAVPLYQKAIQSLPDDFQHKQFSEWRKLPPDQLPVKDVELELKKLKPMLDLVSQAARCKQCNWPTRTAGAVTNQELKEIRKFRQIADILNIQTRFLIQQDLYNKANDTLKTSIAMARHVSDAPTLTHGITGIAIALVALNEVEQLIQKGDSLTFYWALRDLPMPLVDPAKTMDLEIANLRNYNIITRKAFEKQLKPAHEMIRKQINYVDRRVAALQCIEALRLYTGSHKGTFPEKLSNITEVNVPVDPVAKKPFSYKSTGSEAILELEATEGSDGRDAVRYELNLKK
jgi:hypothetical protein